MRTTLDIDQKLIDDLVRESGKKSESAAIEEAALEYLNAKRRERLIARIRRGDLGIDMTLDELRKMREGE